MSGQTIEHRFTRYQIFLIALTSLLQFTVVLDFMVMAPLGAILMRVLTITPSQFGVAVSAYAFSAGISGILAAGFADRFDRKNMLLFFYGGFTFATLLCGIAPTYEILVLARIVTGMFAGVIGAIGMAIIADLFPIHVRGKVMGFSQMAFAASQVLGIPIGIYLANVFDWHAPFLMIVGLCLIIGIAVVFGMKPVREHLKIESGRSAFQHLWLTLKQRPYQRAFAATTLLSVGGFMMLPFSTAFMVHNMGVAEATLPMVFIVTGIVNMLSGPFIGRISDAIGKYKLFVYGSVWTAIVVVVLTHMGLIPLWLVMVLNALMFLGVMSRMIPSMALVSGMPDLHDRGAFMSINSSIQQMAGGVASVVGGLIVAQSATGQIINYDILGYVTIGAIILCAVQMSFVNKYVTNKIYFVTPIGVPVPAADPVGH